MYPTNTYIGISFKTFYSFSFFSTIDLSIFGIKEFLKKNILLDNYPVLGTIGLGRSGSDGSFSENFVEQVSMSFGLKDRFYEIYFGEKNGYMLIGKETVKEDIQMIEWRMFSNY